MAVILNRSLEVIHRSRNLRGLRDYARISPVVGVEVRDTDGRALELHRELTRTGEERPYRRYEYLVQYRNGSIGRDFFADWRVAADFTANRRTWRTHIDLGGRRKALEVDSDVPGFLDLYARLIAPAVPKRAQGRLPVRDDVESVTYHRPPTPGEIRFGHGATHYADFPLEACTFPGTRILKKWFRDSDGVRWSR